MLLRVSSLSCESQPAVSLAQAGEKNSDGILNTMTFIMTYKYLLGNGFWWNLNQLHKDRACNFFWGVGLVLLLFFLGGHVYLFIFCWFVYYNFVLFCVIIFCSVLFCIVLIYLVWFCAVCFWLFFDSTLTTSHKQKVNTVSIKMTYFFKKFPKFVLNKQHIRLNVVVIFKHNLFKTQTVTVSALIIAPVTNALGYILLKIVTK